MAAPTNYNTRNLRNSTITFEDGTTPTALGLLIASEEGNLSFTVGDEAPIIRHRGALQGFADPIEQPVELSFTINFREWTGNTNAATVPSLHDALRGVGNASAWVSTRDCGPFVLDLVFQINQPSNCTDANEMDETLRFSDFRADSFEFSEGEEMDTIVCSGRALVTAPTAVRS